jgi:hypothetical protein
MPDKQTFRVKYRNLEAFIQKRYGFECDVLKAAGVTNGMIPEYVVDGRIPGKYRHLLGRLRGGRTVNNLCLILNDLAAKNLIPVGNYVIDTHRQQDDTETYRFLLRETKSPDSPECMEFKRRRKNDTTLQERFALLDQEMRQMINRSRR